jgi:ubiquinone/menaquinone biosynthesis C-methylase UbiE
MSDSPERQETAPRDTRQHGGATLPRVLTWRTVANSAAYLLPHLRGGLTVLDVGSGPGTLAIDLARLVAPGTVTGVDADPVQVEQAAGLAFDEGVATVRFLVGDVLALPVPDASVDVVHAHQVLQHVPDPVTALREMFRVLRPGGILAAKDADWGAAAWYPKLPALAVWRDVYGAVLERSGGEAEAGRALKAWARRAGFEEVTCTSSMWCFASAAEREWWGRSWSERVLGADFAAEAIETAAAGLADLRGISTAWSEWARDPDGWFGLPHGEIIAVRPA